MVNIERWITEGHLASPADLQVISDLSRTTGLALPDDYLSFLKAHNGGEGFVGERYLILWAAENLVQFNAEYEVAKYAPGIFLFGSTGGGEGYGFDTEQEPMTVIRVPFIGMDRRYATHIASSFGQFIDELGQ